MKIGKIESQIGKAVIGNDGVERTLIGVGDVCSGTKHIEFHCPVCAKDPELYGNGIFRTVWARFKDGVHSCGCSVGFRPNTEQATIRVKRKLIERSSKYDYVGFVGDVFEGSRKTKIIMNCPDHGEFHILYNCFMSTQASGCADCAGGCVFKKDEPATLYVALWTNSVGKKWLKVGVTNHIDDESRMKKQRKRQWENNKERIDYDVRFRMYWNDGLIPWNIETEVVKLREKYGMACTKLEMDDGYRETLPLEAVKELEEIIKDNTWIDVDILNKRYIHVPVKPAPPKPVEKVKRPRGRPRKVVA